MITRQWAFAIHLTLSLLIFSSLVAVLYVYWFPGQLFWLDGGWAGLKLVAVVDLILGPLLTLILFKPGKKGLWTDMAAIATFQIAALGYGFFATYQQQTLGLVFADGAFTTLSYASHQQANDQLLGKGETPQSIRSFGDNNPVHVFTLAPTGKTMGSYLTDILNGYPDPHERSDKYLPIGNNLDALSEYSLDQQELVSRNLWDAVQSTLVQRALVLDDVQFYPFKARYQKGIAIFSPAKMRVVAYVPVDRKKRQKGKTRKNATEAPVADNSVE